VLHLHARVLPGLPEVGEVAQHAAVA
jgi:hypothetical protein